jgi:hypothetical protein
LDLPAARLTLTFGFGAGLFVIRVSSLEDSITFFEVLGLRLLAIPYAICADRELPAEEVGADRGLNAMKMLTSPL